MLKKISQILLHILYPNHWEQMAKLQAETADYKARLKKLREANDQLIAYNKKQLLQNVAITTENKKLRQSNGQYKEAREDYKRVVRQNNSKAWPTAKPQAAHN